MTRSRSILRSLFLTLAIFAALNGIRAVQNEVQSGQTSGTGSASPPASPGPQHALPLPPYEVMNQMPPHGLLGLWRDIPKKAARTALLDRLWVNHVQGMDRTQRSRLTASASEELGLAPLDRKRLTTAFSARASGKARVNSAGFSKNSWEGYRLLHAATQNGGLQGVRGRLDELEKQHNPDKVAMSLARQHIRNVGSANERLGSARYADRLAPSAGLDHVLANVVPVLRDSYSRPDKPGELARLRKSAIANGFRSFIDAQSAGDTRIRDALHYKMFGQSNEESTVKLRKTLNQWRRRQIPVREKIHPNVAPEVREKLEELARCAPLNLVMLPHKEIVPVKRDRSKRAAPVATAGAAQACASVSNPSGASSSARPGIHAQSGPALVLGGQPSDAVTRSGGTQDRSVGAKRPQPGAIEVAGVQTMPRWGQKKRRSDREPVESPPRESSMTPGDTGASSSGSPLASP